MPPQAIDRATLPPFALTMKNLPFLRHLRPTNRRRDVGDAIRLLLIDKVVMHAHHQFHVLANRRMIEAPDLDSAVAAKQSERTRNDQHAVEQAEAHAPAEKCAQ